MGCCCGNLNERVKNLTVCDIGLIKWSVFLTTIIIVKIFPQILTVPYWILITLAIVCMIKPFYKFWLKK